MKLICVPEVNLVFFKDLSVRKEKNFFLKNRTNQPHGKYCDNTSSWVNDTGRLHNRGPVFFFSKIPHKFFTSAFMMQIICCWGFLIGHTRGGTCSRRLLQLRVFDPMFCKSPFPFSLRTESTQNFKSSFLGPYDETKKLQVGKPPEKGPERFSKKNISNSW